MAMITMMVVSGAKMFRVSKECPGFLKWIITNYETLPDVVAFVHGNPFHHSREIVAYIAEVFTRMNQIGFYHFNDVYKDCELFDKKGLCSEWFELMGLGLAKDAPKCYGTFCCAQFAVSRQRLQNVPKSVWQKLYDRVLETAVCYCMVSRHLRNILSLRCACDLLCSFYYYTRTGTHVAPSLG